MSSKFMRASPVPTFQMMIALSQPKNRKKKKAKITTLVSTEEKRKEKAGGTGGDEGLWKCPLATATAGALCRSSWVLVQLQDTEQEMLRAKRRCSCILVCENASQVRGICGRTSQSGTDGKQAKWQQEKQQNKGKKEWQAAKAEVSTFTGTINTAIGWVVLFKDQTARRQRIKPKIRRQQHKEQDWGTR